MPRTSSVLPRLSKPALATLDQLQLVLNQHLTEIPPLLSTRVSGLPAGLDVIVATMLAKRPNARYSSAERLLE